MRFWETKHAWRLRKTLKGPNKTYHLLRGRKINQSIMMNSNLWFGRWYASVGGNPAKIRSLSHCLQGDGTVTYPRWYTTSSNVMSCSLVLWKVESWLKTNKWLTCSSCCLDLFLKKYPSYPFLSIHVSIWFHLETWMEIKTQMILHEGLLPEGTSFPFGSKHEMAWKPWRLVLFTCNPRCSIHLIPLLDFFCVSDCFQLDDENKAHQAGLGPYRDHVKFQDILIYICSIPKQTRHVILGFPGDSPQLHPIRPSFQRHGLGPQYAAMSWNVSNQLQIKGTWNHLTGVIVSPPQTMYY